MNNKIEKSKTQLLAEKVVVASAGTPVQFPFGKPVSDVRLSTAGNTGTVYLASSFDECRDSRHRFSVATGSNFSLKVTDLGHLWVDADTDGDGVSILAEVVSPGVSGG